MDREKTSLPVYAQIADNLIDQIESGDLHPGDRLPTERKLSEQLGVNRMTVRRAFNLLESLGLLNRRQGSGTYVADRKIERQASVLISFTKGMQRRGYLPGARVILFERKVVEASLAKVLDLSDSASVYIVHRLRTINQEPVLLERLTIPVHRFPDFERHDLSTHSLYEVMQMEYGVSLAHARQSLEPVIALDYEASLLEVPVGSPLMLETRVAFDQSSSPVEFGADLYRGDRFQFVTEIAPLEWLGPL
jgi:GntR family transcriptional regulator